MNSRSREFLTRSALTDEHDSRRRRRHAAQLVIKNLHARRATQNSTETAELTEFLAQLTNLVLQRRRLFGVTKNRLNAIQIRGFDQVVARPSPQRSNGAIHRSVSRNDNDFRRLGLVQLTNQLNALAVRQSEVCQEHIRTLAAELYPSVPDAVR